MTELIIRRQQASWQDRMRNYAVLIDGQKAAEIANGAEVRIPVSAGSHVVQLKIDWCRSNALEIVVGENGETIVECGPNGTPILALLYITLWRGKYLWLKAVASVPHVSLQPAFAVNG
ncbi:MAG: hypothetical protein V4484_17795 [Pseudomonadota bacterium]